MVCFSLECFCGVGLGSGLVYKGSKPLLARLKSQSEESAKAQRSERNRDRADSGGKSSQVAKLAFSSRKSFRQVTPEESPTTGDKRSKLVRRASVLIRCIDESQEMLSRSMERMSSAMTDRNYSQGDFLFRQGDAVEHHWVLYRGEVAFLEDDVQVSIESGNPLKEEAPELARPEKSPSVHQRSCQVVSGTAAVMSCGRDAFLELQSECAGSPVRQTLRKGWQSLQEAYRELLSQVELFRLMSDTQRDELAPHLKQITFKKGEYVFKAGDQGDLCYVLLKGKIKVLDDRDREVALLVGDPSMSSAPTFGTRALTYGIPRLTSTLVESESVTLLGLDRERFLQVEKNQLDIHNGGEMESLKYIKYTLDDLDELGLLGKGGFGWVKLVKHKGTSQLLALKAQNKEHVTRTCGVRAVMNERDILRECSLSPWVVRLVACFNKDAEVYFLTELVEGGELRDIYEQANLFGSEEHVRFHAACLLRGLSMLHSRQMVHRDMKPANVLLDARGYCKIADFGLAKLLLGTSSDEGAARTYTICGTANYVAPEMLPPDCEDDGYTVAVDWWALGVIIYELMVGKTPFEAFGKEDIYTNIRQGIRRAEFPSKVDLDSIEKEKRSSMEPPRVIDPNGLWSDLVKSLCAQDEEKRLPLIPPGVRNVEDHAWYCKGDLPEFDWRLLNMRSMLAPYVPAPVQQRTFSQHDIALARESLSQEFKSKSYIEKLLDDDPFSEFTDELGPSYLP